MDMTDVLRLHGIGGKSIPIVSALPTADATQRGKIYRILGGAGQADQVYVCRRKSDGTYAWTIWSDELSDLSEDATHRLITDTERTSWNAKASTAVATTGANGLMSSSDKTKLDGISSGANKVEMSTTNGNIKIDGAQVVVYTHPISHAATMITEDATHRFTTDTEKSTWNAKASTAVVTALANGLMSSSDKTKLDGISSGANKTEASTNGNIKVDGVDTVVYTHPTSHAATMITEDATHRFVTDTEKSTWNAKASTAIATTLANGLMSAGDKTKLNGIATNATKVDNSLVNGNIIINGVESGVYSHPTSHAATMITEDTTHRFVTDTEKSTWNAKASTVVATTLANGLMSASDKSKLDGIASGADVVEVSGTNGNILINGAQAVVYTHPATHAATMITEDATHRFFTDAERTKLSGVSTGANKTEASTTNGNIKVDGAQVVVYTHPASHAATMVTEDATHRFTTDTEKSTWNGKANVNDVNARIPKWSNVLANVGITGIENIIVSANGNNNGPMVSNPAGSVNYPCHNGGSNPAYMVTMFTITAPTLIEVDAFVSLKIDAAISRMVYHSLRMVSGTSYANTLVASSYEVGCHSDGTESSRWFQLGNKWYMKIDTPGTYSIWGQVRLENGMPYSLYAALWYMSVKAYIL